MTEVTYLPTIDGKFLNIYGYHTRGILLNGNIRISGKTIEILAIHLNTQHSRRQCTA